MNAAQMHSEMRERLKRIWERYQYMIEIQAPLVIVANEAALLVDCLAKIHGLGTVLKEIERQIESETRVNHEVCVMEGCPNAASPNKTHMQMCVKCSAEAEEYYKTFAEN